MIGSNTLMQDVPRMWRQESLWPHRSRDLRLIYVGRPLILNFGREVVAHVAHVLDDVLHHDGQVLRQGQDDLRRQGSRLCDTPRGSALAQWTITAQRGRTFVKLFR